MSNSDVPQSVRVALFQPVLSHYRIDLFNDLDRQLGGGLTIFTVDADFRSNLGGAEDRLNVAKRTARTYRLGPLWFVPIALRTVWERRWDVVVLSWNARQVELSFALLLARMRGVPVVLWGHGFGRSGSRASSWLRRRQASLASVVVTYSDRGAREVVEQVPDAVVLPVLNTTGRPVPDAEEVLDGPRHRVVYLGRLLAHKRGEHLIEAVARVRRRGLDLGVDIVGDGPHRPAIEQAVARWGIEDLVTWHGQVTDWAEVRRIIQSGDLVVLPSHAGLAVVDAFAAGRGAMVLDDPGQNPPEADLVIDGETGFRYGPATAGALADRLSEIYEHPVVLIEVSRNVVALYREHLSVDAAASEFAAVLRI